MKIPSTRRLAILGGSAVLFGIAAAIIALIGMAPSTSAEDIDAAQQIVLPVLEPAQASTITEPVSGRPVRITIPSVGIDLQVSNGYYDKASGNWTLSRTQAEFATPSKLANNTSGTTFIYGHDTKIVFHSLHGIKLGDEATVTTDNGYRFVYTFHDSVITTPLSIGEVTAASDIPRLSLQTCYGATSADRHIFHLYLAHVEKI